MFRPIVEPADLRQKPVIFACAAALSAACCCAASETEAGGSGVTRLGFSHLGKLGIAPYLIKLHVSVFLLHCVSKLAACCQGWATTDILLALGQISHCLQHFLGRFHTAQM